MAVRFTAAVAEDDGMSTRAEAFTLNVPDTAIADLRERLARTRFPDQAPGEPWAYGTNVEYLRGLVEYWRTGFDWRAQEARLNAFPQYRAALHDIDVHFLHVPGKGPSPCPLLLMHGWPGSVFEFLDLIPRLTDPARFGGDPADAFTVVAPSLPGYGLSFRPGQKRFGIEEIADCLADLMTDTLGYRRFAAQGGDWGGITASRMGYAHADRLIGIHVNLLAVRRDAQAFTDPAAHGGDAADAFDVVVPSLPGYAFSEPRERGGGHFGFGALFHRLMTGPLGYSRFGAHGGDWGSFVAEQLARSHPSSLAGIHLTDIPFWHSFQKPDKTSAAERKYLASMEEWQKQSGAYAMIQGTRPATAAAALRDSPAGLAAWIVEKFHEWSDCGGDLERSFSIDELLTNVMLYWATGTIETSFQPYADVVSAGAARWIAEAIKEWVGAARTPAGCALFPRDISRPPREWAERFFDVRRWEPMPAGGHFAALEAPDRLAQELRAFFKPLRA